MMARRLTPHGLETSIMSTPFLGEIILVSFNFAPKGYLFCEGQLLPIQQYTALFSLLGTNFGGDGINNFALPDLRGRAPISSGQGPGLSNYFLGEALGVENVTLTVAELADHVHPAGASSASGNSASPGGDVWARSLTRDGVYSSRGANATLAPGAISNTGGGGSHENRPPFLAMRSACAARNLPDPQLSEDLLMKRLFSVFALATLMLLGPKWSVAVGGLVVGDILVSDIGNGTVMVVDPNTGIRSTFSGGGVGGGAGMVDPRGIAIDGQGNVIVADDVNQDILSINPLTGDRTIISGNGVGGGTSFVDPTGVTVGSNGSIYVADGGSGTGSGFIVQVNEATGARTLLSGLGTGSGTGV